jgi:carbonic anhydrase
MPAIARRSLFGLAVAFACPLCNRAMATAAPAEFGYSGEDGPEHWGDLSPDYRFCGMGTQQSPIDLAGTVKARLEHLQIDYQKAPLRIWNNGEYILTNVPAGSTVRWEAGPISCCSSTSIIRASIMSMVKSLRWRPTS